MQRERAPDWKDWQAKLENIGLVYHSAESRYWNSSACYHFNAAEIDSIESATNDLHEMCIDAITQVIEKGTFDRLRTPKDLIPLIIESWEKDFLSIYGRFDLALGKNGEIKLLEYNADTPTSLLESSVAQWTWMKSVYPSEDQFNSIHEKLIQRWKKVAVKDQPLYFTALRDSVEDICNTEYLRDTAIQAKLETEFIFIDEIGWDSLQKKFVDLDNKPISQCFKLYPWEWLIKEQFGLNILGNIHFIEPAWKSLLSGKSILALLWELHPDHPNLLPCFFDRPSTGKFVQKPLWSREGANLKIFDGSKKLVETPGPYGAGDFIYQQYFELPRFGTGGFSGSGESTRYAVVGSWVIGEEAAGIGIREDPSSITGNLSQFVPHYFTKY